MNFPCDVRCQDRRRWPSQRCPRDRRRRCATAVYGGGTLTGAFPPGSVSRHRLVNETAVTLSAAAAFGDGAAPFGASVSHESSGAVYNRL